MRFEQFGPSETHSLVEMNLQTTKSVKLNLENTVPAGNRTAKCGTRAVIHSAMLQPDSLRR